MKNKIRKYFNLERFDIISMIFSLITVIFSFLDLLNKNYKDNIFYYLYILSLIYFIVEYFLKLYLSDDKINFIKSNKLNLIAILPFNYFYNMLKLLQFLNFINYLKILRLLIFLQRLNIRSYKFLRANGFIYVLYLSIIIIFSGATAIYFLEYGITVKSYGDAIWWAFVTATTVGYGDLSPTTSLGRIVATILMITGIGTIGMLTTTISKYFIKLEYRYKNKENSELIKTILESNEIDEEDKELLIDYLEFLKNRKEKNA